MKHIFIFLFFFLCILLFPIKSFADKDFIVSFDMTYAVAENGNTHVTANGNLENILDRQYASSYSIQIGFKDMENILANDLDGKITPKIKDIGNGSVITLPFNRHATGIGNSNSFSFSFDTKDIAIKSGKIWEINIPGIANQNDFKTFNVHLKVPLSFGDPSYIKPFKIGNSLDFNKDELGSSGVSLAFGKNQLYDFQLLYHLKNDNLFPVTTEIALPLDTNYQHIFLESLSPKPDNVTLDADGNWIAKYSLNSSQKITVIAKGKAQIALNPTPEKLSLKDRQLYLQDRPYWQVNNSDIKNIAQQLSTPRDVFDYVTNRLSYDFSRVVGVQERVGALGVLKNPQSAVCLEFTDLFVTLMRAKGIPSREVDGFAYTRDQSQRPLSLVKDILHAWPEYYDDSKGAWIMVDPTWANTTKGIDYFTTLDFDHFAFVIKGKDSIYPIPAGGYKLKGQENVKDVFVNFGTDFPINYPLLSPDFLLPASIFSTNNITGNVFLKNVGGVYFPPQDILITTSDLLPKTQTIHSNGIPPFGFSSISVFFDKTSFLTNRKETITMQIGGNIIVKQIYVYPFFLQRNFLLGGITFVIFTIIILTITTKPWSLSIFRRK